MSQEFPSVFENRTVVAGALDTQAIMLGGNLGAIFGLLALMLPIFGVLTGGLVCGFVVAYALRGVRGVIHGILAGAVAGIISGVVVGLTGSMLGLFMEPPSLVWDLLASGPVSPRVTFRDYEALWVGASVALIILADAVLGAALGSSARVVADAIRDN